MPFEVTQLGNEAIIIAALILPIDMEVEPPLTLAAANAIARRIAGTVYRITDITRFEPTFEQVIAGMAADLRYSEPNIRHIFVGKGEMVELLANAMKQPQYGAQEAHMCTSMDEAIAYARQKLSAG